MSGHGHGHGHGHHLADPALAACREGLRALWVSFAALSATAGVQAVVVVVSGSAALLGDTLHNVGDALTAVPLAIAFLVGRRAPTRRYTYGFGRAEDLAGLAVLATIAVSGAVAGYVSVQRLLDRAEVEALVAVAAAGLVGFVGNEWVARYRIRVGRRIGSAALVADGLHARTDGFASLAVVLSAGAVAAGFPLADPIIGLGITAAICLVLRQAAREVYGRLMDAVDPALTARAEAALRSTAGVRDVGDLRLRWLGHSLHAEAEITVDADLTLAEAHRVAVEAEHALHHALQRLTSATVHADPASAAGAAHHKRLAHH